MPWPVLVPAAEADIEEALFNTLSKWGNAKYVQYAMLIEEALEVLAENPRQGQPKPAIHPEAWIYLIRKPGRRARHLFLYEIASDGTPQIYGLIYDARDLPRLWHERRLGPKPTLGG